MTESARETLRAELGGSVPPFLDQLEDSEASDLAAALSESRARQSVAVEEAIDHAMRFIPWPLRGTVKRVLIG